ncbi:uncharacterized protein MAM_08259 [Metarhizium album ARSEF 1941]|uniref:Uncharacterized protein n=1 Tax=Metarhizium album (strain ARSEF 1941) TaxID=1081103 RepID=A0A0B2WJM8_METAS|nr:uncharacterized protein MAM_08259 [Metarhizium album ARSEF 1941]KHN93899.1 hypothetical protein MAM_08259 [Metarhizium album ARSEF 1941]
MKLRDGLVVLLALRATAAARLSSPHAPGLQVVQFQDGSALGRATPLVDPVPRGSLPRRGLLGIGRRSRPKHRPKQSASKPAKPPVAESHPVISAREASRIKSPDCGKSGVFFRGDSRPPWEIFASGSALSQLLEACELAAVQPPAERDVRETLSQHRQALQDGILRLNELRNKLIDHRRQVREKVNTGGHVENMCDVKPQTVPIPDGNESGPVVAAPSWAAEPRVKAAAIPYDWALCRKAVMLRGTETCYSPAGLAKPGTASPLRLSTLSRGCSRTGRPVNSLKGV